MHLNRQWSFEGALWCILASQNVSVITRIAEIRRARHWKETKTLDVRFSLHPGSIMCIWFVLLSAPGGSGTRPPSKVSFCCNKGLTAQTLAPDDAQGRSMQVTAGRGQVRSSQAVSSQVKPSQVKSSQVKSSQVKPSQVKSSQVKPRQAKSSQVKSSQDKSNHLEETIT